ncbi:hypothetical protein B0O80DRAFT_427462 [Mortierella sp. GBAus27b]|nr:hypothetical protein BGX31_001760 [Mortierella sp. GBA43]KAI8352264.1 hypothetical protein B0O80DRAFT_427462 [Mortierella sp. GBAus27b]
MTDITELDDQIFEKMDKRELAQCSRVCKKWYAIVAPYLWRDLSLLENSSDAQRRAFTRLVLEDYVSEQDRAKLQEPGSNTDTLSPTQTSLPLSTLAKHRAWIRVLPSYDSLLLPGEPDTDEQDSNEPDTDETGPNEPDTDESSSNESSSNEPRSNEPDTGGSDTDESEQASIGTEKTPTKHELFLHLMTHYDTASVSRFLLDYEEYKSKPSKRDIVELAVPRSRHLTIQATYHENFSKFSRLKHLLNQCSVALEELTLDVNHAFLDEECEESDDEEQESTETKDWTSFKKLDLSLRMFTGMDPEPFWSWLYKQCGRVEQLKISKIRSETDIAISRAMLNHMPNLSAITLGHIHGKDVAAPCIRSIRAYRLLSTPGKRWKTVRLMGTVRFGPDARDALTRHSSTLEELYLHQGFRGLTGADLVNILKSSSNLHTFEDSDLHPYMGNPSWYRFTANVMHDEEYQTYKPNPWQCESSLKVLKIKILGISRPDLNAGGVGDADTSGQQQTHQKPIYERLSRMTRLETLWLGNRPYNSYLNTEGDMQDQLDCLEMSLESGLHILSSLRSLRELSVAGMSTRIGLKEVQWMVLHWRRLRVIYGLDEDGYGKEAVEWLKEHHPEIAVLRMN